MKKFSVLSLIVALFLLVTLAGCSDQCDCCNEDNFPKHGNTVSPTQVSFCAIAYEWKLESSAVYKQPTATCKTFIDREKSLEINTKLLAYDHDSFDIVRDKTSSELLKTARQNGALMVVQKVSATRSADADGLTSMDRTYNFVFAYYVQSDGTVYKDDGFDIRTYTLTDNATYEYLASLAR